MKRNFNATVWQEGEWFIAQCLEVDVASQGASEAEALANLSDALELHFAPPVAMQEAMNDELFLADLRETMADFRHADAEGTRAPARYRRRY